MPPKGGGWSPPLPIHNSPGLTLAPHLQGERIERDKGKEKGTEMGTAYNLQRHVLWAGPGGTSESLWSLFKKFALSNFFLPSVFLKIFSGGETECFI